MRHGVYLPPIGTTGTSMLVELAVAAGEAGGALS
jgi:hypothetical protein